MVERSVNGYTKRNCLAQGVKTVSMPAATLGYGSSFTPKMIQQPNTDMTVGNMAPSKDEIAEWRYNFYSQNYPARHDVVPQGQQFNFMATTRQDVVPQTQPFNCVPKVNQDVVSQGQQFLNSNNFTESHFTLSKTDIVPPRSHKPSFGDDLPSPNMMYSVIKFKDALVALEIDSFDDYIVRVSKFRALTIEEKDEVKMIARRIKNRESARRSRREKKDHFADLEKEVRQLKSQVEHMRMELASLRSENTYLKNEVQFSSSIISSNPTLAQIYSENICHMNPSLNFTNPHDNE